MMLAGLAWLPATDNLTPDVAAADDARVAALLANDLAKLGPFLSEDLSYGHSDGRVETKAEFLHALTGAKTRYESITYLDRNLATAAPGIVILTGRARMKLLHDGKPLAFTLRIHGVWREEAGQWRLLAYQSARLPEPAAVAKP